jgi:hypothetical protein
MFEEINGTTKPVDQPSVLPRQVRFVHLRRPLITLGRLGLEMGGAASTGGLTVAYSKTGENQYVVAVARCNATDHYNKLLGRTCSKATLLSDDDVWTLELSEGASFYEGLIETLTNIRQFKKNLTPVILKGN